MNEWFNCKISFLKQLENGTITKKAENYLVNAMTFTEAEARLHSILEEYISDFQLLTCAKTKVNGIMIDESKDKFYKTKVVFPSFDEESGKEKKAVEMFIIQANSLKEAYEKTEQKMAGSVVDWDIPSINEFNVVDIFPYEGGAIQNKKFAKQEEE